MTFIISAGTGTSTVGGAGLRTETMGVGAGRIEAGRQQMASAIIDKRVLKN
jgi:hypothetical protein